jgi:hypothetical protein
MIEQRRLVAALAGGDPIQIVGEDGGDAPVVHRADLVAEIASARIGSMPR